uniref:Uncharacterized protein n=1 Tax=Oryza rufipogon TaxID=4529 RepID=A0A0E0Q817_ORYRU
MKAVAAARRGEPYIARLICRRARRQHGRSTGATVDLDGSLTRQACHHTVLEPGRPSEVWCCVPPHPLPHAATRLESLRLTRNASSQPLLLGDYFSLPSSPGSNRASSCHRSRMLLEEEILAARLRKSSILHRRRFLKFKNWCNS